MDRYLPERPEIVDVLYNLQAVREMSGNEPEMALISGGVLEWAENCSVIVDEKTGDRIVLTHLPTDQAEFDGATIWMSNLEKGVTIEEEGWEVTAKDVIFWVDSSVRTSYFNPHSGSFRPFDPDVLAKRIDMPKIKPIAVSEYDPRYVPSEEELSQFEHISTPNTDAYTLASRIFDTQLVEDKTLIAKASGVIEVRDGETTTYDLEITENMPEFNKLSRITEFDREFEVAVTTGDKLNFTVYPWGKKYTQGVGKKFMITVLREGLIVDMAMGGKIVHCMPSHEMRLFINRLLHNAEHFRV